MARVSTFSPIGFAFAVLAALLIQVVPTPPANAAAPADLIFPVVGPNNYSDTFGACRSGCSRTHQGIDIMAPKMTPVVAADDGVVKYVNWSWTEAGIDPSRCCTMVIQHTDGFQSWYLHMNNDTPGTDDGLGWGIAPGIVPGVSVYKGQLIGWVGDSGNAEATGPHIQFEYHDPNGTVLNPMPYLDGAQVISAPIEAVQYTLDYSDFTNIVSPTQSQLVIDAASTDVAWSVDVTRQLGPRAFIATGVGSRTLVWDGTGYAAGPYIGTADFGEYGSEQWWVQIGDYEWPFVDDEGSFAVAEIAEMFERGFTTGCDWNRFCPSDTLSRAQLMTMVARSVANGAAYPSYQGYYSDVESGQWYTGPVEYLVDQGILTGGGDLGINYGASRALIVDVLMTAIVGPSGYGPYMGYFTDVPENAWYRPKVELAYEMGIVNGYPDGTFRPGDTLSREEAVALLMRGL